MLRCEAEHEVEMDVVNGHINCRGTMFPEGIGDEVAISDRTAGSVSVTHTTDAASVSVTQATDWPWGNGCMVGVVSNVDQTSRVVSIAPAISAMIGDDVRSRVSCAMDLDV